MGSIILTDPFADELASWLEAPPAPPVGMGRPVAWILGPRGAGKSTLLELLHGLVSGSASLDAAAVGVSPERSARLLDAARGYRARHAPLVVRVDLAPMGEPILASFVRRAVAAQLGASGSAADLIPIASPVSPMRAAAETRRAVDDICDMLRRRAAGRLLWIGIDGLDDHPAPAQLDPLLELLARRARGRVSIVACATLDGPGASIRPVVPRAGEPRIELDVDAVAGVLEDAHGPVPAALVELLLRATGALRAERRRAGRAAGAPTLHGLIGALRTGPGAGGVQSEAAFDALAPELHDEDVLSAVARARAADPDCARVAKTIALDRLASEGAPTPSSRLARLVHPSLDAEALAGALERLERNGVIDAAGAGYAIRDRLRTRWARDREVYGVTDQESSDLVREALRSLVASLPPPRIGDAQLPWRALYADGKVAHDVLVLGSKLVPSMTLDLRFLPPYRRSDAEWRGRSARGVLRDRLIWVADGSFDRVRAASIELGRSRRMIGLYRRPAPDALLGWEQARESGLADALRAAVAAAFMEGRCYIRGTPAAARSFASDFGAALLAAVAWCDQPQLMS